MEIIAASYLLAVSEPAFSDGAVAIDNGTIVDVGPLSALRRRYPAPVPVKEFPGCVLMPGLVNAHSHLELTHFPAWKIRKGLDYAPRTYVDWVIQLIKIKRGLSLNELELSLREGIRISLEAGTTTVGDILSDRRLLPLYGGSLLGGRIYLELLGYDTLYCAEQLRLVEDLLDEFPQGAFRPGLSPHSPHTVSTSYFKDIARTAAARSLPLVVHAAESPDEAAFLHDSTGTIAATLFPFVHWEPFLPAPMRKTAVEFLDAAGALGSSASVVHGVHVTAKDVEILKSRDVSIILCPRSNDRLVVGKAPAALLKKAGVQLALATDSLASNDSLSLWDEMRFLRGCYPGLFSPDEILEMVTLAPARALQMADAVGCLEQGKRADLLLVKLSSVVPLTEIAEAVIEEGVVQEVMVAGRQV